MSSLKNKITALTDNVAIKLNALHAAKERISNKKQDLTSGLASDYPSVPAVNAGLASTLQQAKDYSDQQWTDRPHVVEDEFYVRTDNNFTNAERDKLSTMEGSKFKGQYTNLANLIAAHPAPEVGSYANVDEGVGFQVVRYVWDSNDEEWIKQGGENTQVTASEVKSLYESNSNTNAFTDNDKTNLDANTAHRNNTSNPHNTTKAQVGLGNVDNTSDANKPVSFAQAAAIAVVQDDLDAYKAEVGTGFPDYVAQLNAETNF